LFARGELGDRREADLVLPASSGCERSTIGHEPRVVRRPIEAPARRQPAAIGHRGIELPCTKTCAVVAPAHARGAREELRMT
jgi:hypothetical protein